MAATALALEEQIDVPLFGSCMLFTEKRERMAVKELWKDQTAVLVFLRHFGCIACRAHAAKTWKARASLTRGGAKLYFVGNGPPGMIEQFKSEIDMVDGEVYTDPSLVSFRIAGFNRGFFKAYNLDSLANVFQLYKEGHRQTFTLQDTGSHIQLGGTIIVTPDERVVFHHISESIGDFAPDGELASKVATNG